MNKISRRGFIKAVGETAFLTTVTGVLGACGAKVKVRDKEQIKELVFIKQK